MSSSKDLTDAIDALSRPARHPRYGERPPARGEAPRVAVSGSPPGGGGKSAAAGDLTELDAATREYYADGWRTTDGIFVFPAIKRLRLYDDNGNERVIAFDEP